MAKEQELDIAILGHVSPSLMAAVNQAKAQLKSIGADARTSSEVMKRLYAQAFDGVGKSAKKGEHEVKGAFGHMVEHAQHAAHAIQHSFSHAFHEIGTEVLKGIGFGAGFSIVGNIAQGIGSVIEGAKELAHGAVEVHAEREALQATIHSILSSQGRGGQAAEMDMMFRGFEGQKGPQTYQQLSMATAQLLGAAPERFKTVGSVETQLQHLADVSRDANAFSGVTQAYTRILAEGKVDAAHLREMSVDTGFNFKKAMADALKVTPEQLSEMISKHKLSGEKSIEALMKGMELVTGPGGAAYQHAEAQLQGLNGIFKRFEGHFQDFQDSFGMQMENFLRPVANSVLKYLTPAVLTHAFDSFEMYAKSFGQAIAYLVHSFGEGEQAGKIQTLGTAISTFFSGIFGSTGDLMQLQHVNANETEWMLNPKFQKGLDETAHSIGEFMDSLSKVLSDKDVIVTVTALMKDFAAASAGFFRDFASLIKQINMAIHGDFGGAMREGHELEQRDRTASLQHWTEAAVERLKVDAQRAGESVKANEQYQGTLRDVRQNLQKMKEDKGILPQDVETRDRAVSRLEQGTAEAEAIAAKMVDSSSSAEAIKADIAQAAVHAAQVESATAQAASDAERIRHSLENINVKLQISSPIPAGAAGHALGGIVRRPTLTWVGERNAPEAIVPLNRKPRSYALLGAANRAMGVGREGEGRGGGGATITINSSPVINGGGNVHSIRSLLREHAEDIAEAVKRVLATESAAMALV